MQLQFEVKTNKKLCDCSLKLKQQKTMQLQFEININSSKKPLIILFLKNVSPLI